MAGMQTPLTICVWRHALNPILAIILHGNVYFNVLFLSYLLEKVSIEHVSICVLKELMLIHIVRNVFNIVLEPYMILMPMNLIIPAFNNAHILCMDIL